MLSHKMVRNLTFGIAAFLVALTAPCVAESAVPPQAPSTPPADAASGVRPAPQGTASAPSDYLIGPDDVVGVLFWREPDMSGDLTVRPDGRITLPVIGEVQAAGLHPDELRAQIQDAAGKYLTEPNVAVVIRQVNSRKVFITGRVTNPGTYPLTAPLSVVQLIALAGGLTEYADSKHIAIVRNEDGRARIFKFNYKDVAKGKKLEQNIQLMPGDTVVVP